MPKKKIMKKVKRNKPKLTKDGIEFYKAATAINAEEIRCQYNKLRTYCLILVGIILILTIASVYYRELSQYLLENYCSINQMYYKIKGPARYYNSYIKLIGRYEAGIECNYGIGD